MRAALLRCSAVALPASSDTDLRKSIICHILYPVPAVMRAELPTTKSTVFKHKEMLFPSDVERNSLKPNGTTLLINIL